MADHSIASEVTSMKSFIKPTPFQIKQIALSTILALTLLVAGCSRSLAKPTLDPQYQTSSPIATFLRGETLTGLTDYLNFPALVEAKANQDPNLLAINEIPRLASVPDLFFPTFSASISEVMVTYSDTTDSNRKFVIYGNVSDDPQTFLDDFTQDAYFTKEQIGEEDFYLLDVDDEAADLEAYTIRGEWFIHFTGYGMELPEFKGLLGDVELSSLTQGE